MKKLLLFVFAAFVFAACEQAPVKEQSAIRQDAPETLTVGFEGDDTRIQLNETQKTVWTKGDQVSVFYFSDANQLWQYDGETGARTANLKRVNAGEPTVQTTYNVAAYPFNEGYFLNTGTGALHATLPATQHYLRDSYGVGDNLMVAQSEITQFSLKNVCGWLKLQLTGDGEVVKSITFKGNDGEQVAGLIHVDTATAEATLASEMGSTDDTILTEVTLDCGAGVTLGAETTAFYIAIPPQTFEKGFKIEIVCADDTKMVKSSSNTLTIERNHIQPMAEISYAANISPSNQIWYTSSDGNIVEPYNTYGFGANITSNEYNNGMGVITFDGDVTTIGEYAFSSCDSLTSVNIPDSVTQIAERAFRYCYSLTSVNIPDSVTEIGGYAFYDCDSLTSVNIPDSVTKIGNQAFEGCTSLTEFKGKFATEDGRSLIVDNTIIVYANASGTTYTIPNSVTEIGSSAFAGCDSLTSVNIPDSVTTIRDHAFYSCKSLTSVNIPDSITTIGTGAFGYCTSLTSVNIPDSITTIGGWAFSRCDSLTSVNIPDSVTEIGGYAFYDCDSLTSVNIGNSVTSIGQEAFSCCKSLTSVYFKVTIPPSLGYDAFYNTASLRRIYVYEECVELYKSEWSSVKDIIFTNGENCPDTTTIQYTTNDGNIITSSKLPIISNIYDNGVGTLVYSGKQIPNYAFANCTGLTSVTIGDSVITIGNHAFASCTSLTSVYCKATTPPALGGYAFVVNGSGRKIYVPSESVDAYKSAEGWNEYASAIVGYNF